MSNEEIAARIQAGEQGWLGELWKNVEKLVRWKAKRVITAIDGQGGVEFDDLYNAGYLAVVAAVKTYNPEAGSFANWLMFYLQQEFEKASGYRTVKEKRDPLRNSLSLDKPVGEEADGATFGDLIPDASAAATMEGIEEKMWREQLHETLEAALKEIPKEQAAVLRCRFYENQTLDKTAQVLGTTANEVRKRENGGLKTLRHPRFAKRLRSFYDFDYYGGASLGAFKRSGLSIQERYLIIQERHEEKQAVLVSE